ncbi:hypothetical protein F66182_3098 [Fusarium sp. NRRL 66182]|nr:hypothetical protein F66182_3098 [Fusarium sp. NRRL 66182]
MSASPWSTKFVASHFLLTEPEPKGGETWNTIPDYWANTRFDAIDVLFISPFHVKPDDLTLELGEGAKNLVERFNWVIRAARSKNPNIIIVLEQFYHDPDQVPSSDFQLFNVDQGKIKTYADSVASFIESYYNKTLPAVSGSGHVSARIQGYDVDVEGSTQEPDLPKILSAVRQSLDTLSQKLGGPRFSVSISPAWTDYFDSSMAKSCDYINMQNYSGGAETFPQDYHDAIHGLQQNQLVWGFCSEQPDHSTPDCQTFSGMKTQAQKIKSGGFVGTYTWRVNSDNHVFENIYQVWLHNLIHGNTLPDSKPESLVDKYWPTGGRDANGNVIPNLA